MKNILLAFIFGCILVSCGSDDDICMSGEATPRMKVKLKDTRNRAYRIPQIFVDADYGNGMQRIIAARSVDSLFIPLRVDNSTITKLNIRIEDKGEAAEVDINYNLKSQYVSPACGVKRLYEDVTGILQKPNPVLKVEQQQNQIINETDTHFNFIFNAG